MSRFEYLSTLLFGILVAVASVAFLIYALVAYWDYIPYIFR